jgi:acetyl-CoA C-acetyltransferase
MADAASLLLIGDESLGERIGKIPRARIIAAATVCDDPLQVVSGCAKATASLMSQENLTPEGVDLFELHEAFAATSIKCQRDLGISHEKLNVNGGVIALGHPMGATGGIMMGTLLDELERREPENWYRCRQRRSWKWNRSADPETVVKFCLRKSSNKNG